MLEFEEDDDSQEANGDNDDFFDIEEREPEKPSEDKLAVPGNYALNIFRH